MTFDARILGPDAPRQHLVYLGVADVDARGDRASFDPGALRFAPNFGRADGEMPGIEMPDSVVPDIAMPDSELPDLALGARNRGPRALPPPKAPPRLPPPGHLKKKPRRWVRTALSGTYTETTTVAGSATVTLSTTVQIRTQHHFVSEDLRIVTSGTIGATDSFGTNLKLNSVLLKRLAFGSKKILDSTSGIPAQAFATSSYLRDQIKGARLRGGLDVILDVDVSVTNSSTGTSTASASVYFTFHGRKPRRRRC